MAKGSSLKRDIITKEKLKLQNRKNTRMDQTKGQ